MKRQEDTIIDDVGEAVGASLGGMVGLVAGTVAGLVKAADSGDLAKFPEGYFKTGDKCVQHGAVIGRKHFANVAFSIVGGLLLKGGSGGRTRT